MAKQFNQASKEELRILRQNMNRSQSIRSLLEHSSWEGRS